MAAVAAVLAFLAVVTPVSAADRPVADAVVRDAQPVSFPSAAMDQTSSVTTAIDCPADGECVAGGEVQSPTDPAQVMPFIVVQKLGVWGTAQVLTLDAATFGQVDVVRIVAIDCPSVGECEGQAGIPAGMPWNGGQGPVVSLVPRSTTG